MSTDPIIPDLLVPVTPPVLPLTLVKTGFLTTLSTVEKQVAELKITDAATAQLAANLQVRLTGAGKQLEAARVECKRPFLEIERKIDEAAKAPAARIDAAKKKLQHAQIQFDLDQRKIAAEAEEKRLAELKRLEEKRAAEEREAQRKAAEIAAEQKHAADAAKAAGAEPEMEVDFGDDGPATPPPPPPKTETELEIERVKFAPSPAAAKPTGIAFKTRLRAIVEDVNKLPDHFVTKTPKDAAIYSTFCTGWKEGAPIPECPGVRFEIDRQAVSTGKEQF